MSEPIFAAASAVGKLRWLEKIMRTAGLTRRAKLVAVALVLRHNSKDGRLFPGAADLADLAGLSRRSAQLGRDELVAAGLVASIRRFAGVAAGRKWNLSNAYRLVGAELEVARKGMAETPLPGGAATPGGGERRSPEPLNLEPEKEPEGVARDGEGRGAARPAELALWRGVRARLERQRGAVWVRAWLDRARLVGLAGGVLELAAATPCAADYLRREAGAIRDAAIAAGVGIRAVEISAGGLSPAQGAPLDSNQTS